MERALNDILVIVWTCVWGEVVCNVADMCLSLLFQICAAAAVLLLPSSAPVAPKLEGSIFWRFSRENALVGTAVMSHISMKLIHYCASCLYIRWGSPPVYVHSDVYMAWINISLIFAHQKHLPICCQMTIFEHVGFINFFFNIFHFNSIYDFDLPILRGKLFLWTLSFCWKPLFLCYESS